jgi:toxin ParE2
MMPLVTTKKSMFKLAQDFLDQVHLAIDRIQTFSKAWQPVSSSVRRCRLKRFPYGLVYKSSASGVLILAVMHLRRAPEYWAYRL